MRRVERLKAAFLTEYRALCERHGLQVIHMSNGEDEYSPFRVATADPELLAAAVQEMLLEPVVAVRHESPREVGRGDGDGQ